MSKKANFTKTIETFEQMNEGTVATRVFKALKRSIVQLDLEPGNALSEADLAKSLGVSRQPVREAFIKLADVGLVEIKPQRGTFVLLISYREVTNAQFLREAIEVAMIRKATEMQPKGLVEELYRLLDLQELAHKHHNNAEFLKLDEAYHSTIAESVDCEMGWRLVVDMKAQLDRVRYLSLDSATPVTTLIAQHREIAQAIASGSTSAAQEHMEQHLRQILTSLPNIREQNSKLFTA
ncbi:GntR family transcriptional regulator [Polycladidibacter stylochi]|uniref:GntR family transcriptional regulator n=1 Tax=Polycladidibacter stylochi TaxID=1807766 RepID=UPI000AE83AE1|nr:GntR family transcriptional regulator [Pseudovibrio stylochi]